MFELHIAIWRSTFMLAGIIKRCAGNIQQRRGGYVNTELFWSLLVCAVVLGGVIGHYLAKRKTKAQYIGEHLQETARWNKGIKEDKHGAA